MALQKPREFALNALCRAEKESLHIESALAQALEGALLQPVDRSLAQELAFGAVRWRLTLDWLISRKARQAPSNPALRWILRLGLYQLFWLNRIPDHAAVHEAVDLARGWGLSKQSGFVNALLRNYLRDRQATRLALEELKRSRPDLGYSHPPWLCRRWTDRWGPDLLRQCLQWNNSPPLLYARRNSLKATADTLAAQWRQEDVDFNPKSYDWTGPDLVYHVRTGTDVTRLESFQQGFFYLQDPSTLLAVAMLHPLPGEAILDACAAPGGKTTFMAQQMQNKGQIMAQDLDILRRNAIKENCLRLGVHNVTISRAATGINPELSEPFDAVLVDAPCSNTGVMRRRVDLRWRLSQGALDSMPPRQVELLKTHAPQVRPEGRLVYSTCSLEREENEEVVRRFLDETPGFELEAERSLRPWTDSVDGAYVARMRRRS